MRKTSHTRFLLSVLLVSVGAVTFFPVYIVFVLSPSFSDLLIENTKREAVRFATLLSTVLISDTRMLTGEAFPQGFLDRMPLISGDSRIVKLKIYSTSGEVIYSSNPLEVGQRNQESYFADLRQHGDVHAEVVSKNMKSLEQETMSSDVVETYVPIWRGDDLAGILEIYYDISTDRRRLRSLLFTSYGILFSIALCLMIAAVMSTMNAYRSMRERVRAEEALRHLSLTDELTGLYNRRGFLTLSSQQIKSAKREGRPMLLIAADLDGLKNVNDRYGHHEGDRALSDAAHAIRQNLRKSDLIARMGGDEFVALLTRGHEMFEIDRISQRINESLKKRNALGYGYELSMSFGFAHYDPQSDTTLEDMIKGADRMMYERKREKRTS